jgi:hypothetical protein
VRLVLGLAAWPGEDRLDILELLLTDDRRVGDLPGEDPLISRLSSASWLSATFSTSSRTSSVRCRFHTW